MGKNKCEEIEIIVCCLISGLSGLNLTYVKSLEEMSKPG